MNTKKETIIEIDPDTGEEWVSITETDDDGNIVSVEIE